MFTNTGIKTKGFLCKRNRIPVVSVDKLLNSIKLGRQRFKNVQVLLRSREFASQKFSLKQ
jgi:hypothetical protein